MQKMQTRLLEFAIPGRGPKMKCAKCLYAYKMCELKVPIKESYKERPEIGKKDIYCGKKHKLKSSKHRGCSKGVLDPLSEWIFV